MLESRLVTDSSLSKRSHVFSTPPPEGSLFRVREESGVNPSVVEAARPRYPKRSTFSVCPHYSEVIHF